MINCISTRAAICIGEGNGIRINVYGGASSNGVNLENKEVHTTRAYLLQVYICVCVCVRGGGGVS